MALERTIGGDGNLFVACDVTLRFPLPDAEHVDAWVVLFDVRLRDNSASFIVEAPAAVVGTKAVVALTADQMNLFRERTYRYSLKRMDDGDETVLFFGDFKPQKATAPKAVGP
jgi:hypothetical protein